MEESATYKISVIVTVHNEEEHLTEGIMSVIKQSYRNIELILVDDGSMDRSGKICDVSAETSGRTRVIHKDNGGVVSAWKAGVEAATGDYVCFMDGEDTLSGIMVEEMAKHLTGRTDEIVACDMVTEFPDKSRRYSWNTLEPGEYDRDKVRNTIVPNLVGKETRFMLMSRCGKLISRDLIINNFKYTDEGIVRGEDFVIMLPCIIDAGRIFILERKPFYFHRGDEIGLGFQYDTKLEPSLLPLYEQGLKIVEEKFSGVEKTFRITQMDEEYLIRLVAVLKNEALCNKVVYRNNILKAVKTEDVRCMVKDVKPVFADPENKAAYFVIKHPNTLTCTLLRGYLLYRKYRTK